MKHLSREQEWLEGEAQDVFWGQANPLHNLQVTFAPGPDGYVLPSVPSYIGLEVTNTCNLQCIHCHYRHGSMGYTREKGYMSEEIFEIAISEAARNSITVLMNYDGEPFMHPRFLDYLQRATDLGVNSYFNTNATLLTPEKSERLLSFYKGSIFISIEGSREWFEKIRVPARYETVRRNVEYLIGANDRLNRPVKISLSISNLGQVLEERLATINQWLEKVDAISFGEVNDDCGAIVSRPYVQMQPKKRPLCVVPWQTCGICHNGDVIPCSIYIAKANTTDAILGNITQNSLEKIWHGDAYTRFRKAILAYNYRDELCQKCERWRSQFTFADEKRHQMLIRRSGFWTVIHNTKANPSGKVV